MWTLPNVGSAQNCVFRLRYNISTGNDELIIIIIIIIIINNNNNNNNNDEDYKDVIIIMKDYKNLMV